MIKKTYVIQDEITGVLYESENESYYNELLSDLINQYTVQTFYSPLNNETVTFYKPIRVIKERCEDDESIKEKAIITKYIEIYNPYSMD